MFRELRRIKQALTNEECIEILKTCSTGILAVLGDNDYPYAVPLNYVYNDNKIIIHCAKSGHKIDSIMKNNKVSFCIVEKDTVIPEKFATNYSSVVAFGKATLIDDEKMMRTALEHLNKKYSPNYEVEGQKEIDDSINSVLIIQIEIEHLSGKKSRD